MAQKPLCDRRLRPWPSGLARLSGARRAPRRPEAPLFGRKRAARLGSGRRGPGWGKGCACHCGAGYGEGAAAGSPPDPCRRGVGGAAGEADNGLGREISGLGGRRGTGAWCSHPCAPRPGPAPQTKWPRRPRLTEGAARTRDCGAERGCRGRAPERTAACAELRPSGAFREQESCGGWSEALLGEETDSLPRPAPSVSTW